MNIKKHLSGGLLLPMIGIGLMQISASALATNFDLTKLALEPCFNSVPAQQYLTVKKTDCTQNLNYFTELNSKDLGRNTLLDFQITNGFGFNGIAKAVYFNAGDLGFGRHMNCWSKNQNAYTLGTPLTHLACFVGNYGAVGADETNQLSSLIEATLDAEQTTTGFYDVDKSKAAGHRPFATVAMEFNKGKNNEIAFYAYDANGNAVRQVELDSEGVKSIPGACIVCHGGTASADGATVTNSNFLPFDFNSFKFLGIYKDINKKTDTTKLQVVSADTQDSADNNVRTQLDGIAALNTLVYNQQKGAGKLNGQINTLLLVGDDNTRPLYNSVGAENFEDGIVNGRNVAQKAANKSCRGCHIAQDTYLASAVASTSINRICNPTAGTPINGVQYHMSHAELAAANGIDFFKKYMSLPEVKETCNFDKITKINPKPRNPVNPVVAVANLGATISNSFKIIEREINNEGAIFERFVLNTGEVFSHNAINFTQAETTNDPTLPNQENLKGSDWVIDGVNNFDTTNNGSKDFYLRNYRTGQNAIFSMSDLRVLSTIKATVIPVNFRAVGVGEFENNAGDNSPKDVLYRDTDQGEIYIVKDGTLNPNNPIRVEGLASNDLNHEIVAIGNFGGDKKSEILFRDKENGKLNIVSIDNTITSVDGAKAFAHNLTTVANKDWYVAGTGDLDNNGFDDIIWRNSITNEVYYYAIGNDFNLIREGYITADSSANHFMTSDWILVGTSNILVNNDTRLTLVWRNISKTADNKSQYKTWTTTNLLGDVKEFTTNIN